MTDKIRVDRELIEDAYGALDNCAQWMNTREKQIPGLERLSDRAGECCRRLWKALEEVK